MNVIQSPNKRLSSGSTDQPDVDFSIVMPCLNEAETLAVCITKAFHGLNEAGVKGEVLIADNGSSDGSQEIAKRNGARVIDVADKGYGNALRSGIKEARGKWFIMGDADDSYDFSRIGEFVKELKNGNDLVMGCRLPKGGGTIMPGAMPWKHRWIGNPVLSFIGRLFFRSNVDDFHCGLRGGSKVAIEGLGLNTTGMEFASEMVIKAAFKDLQIAQVPITLHKDGRTRAPHLRSWRDGWRHLRFMLLYSPRWLFLYPGLLMMVVGLFVSGLLLAGPKTIAGVTFDVHTLVYFLFAISLGLQTVFFGMLTKSFAIREGLLPDDEKMNYVRRIFSLEAGLVMSAALIVTGIAFGGFALLRWSNSDFGAMDTSSTMRLVLPSVLAMVTGVQLIFNSFFLSVLHLKR